MSENDPRPWAAPGHEHREAPATAAPPYPTDPYAAPGHPAAPPPGRPSGLPPGYPAASPAAHPAVPPGGPAPAFAVDERHRARVLDGPGYTSPQHRNDRVAVAALVLGLVGILVPGICLIAVALGHLGMHRVRTSYHGGRGLAVAGAVLGYIMTAVWLAVVILQLVLNNL